MLVVCVSWYTQILIGKVRLHLKFTGIRSSPQKDTGVNKNRKYKNTSRTSNYPHTLVHGGRVIHVLPACLIERLSHTHIGSAYHVRDSLKTMCYDISFTCTPLSCMYMMLALNACMLGSIGLLFTSPVVTRKGYTQCRLTAMYDAFDSNKRY